MTIFRKLYETHKVQPKKQRCVSPMLKFLLHLSLATWLLATPQLGHAQQPNYAYVGLEPDIVTNYAGDNSKKLGYVRVTIEMMVADPSKIINVEHHMPLFKSDCNRSLWSKA